MISLEQLKKQAANAKQEKEEIKKKDRKDYFLEFLKSTY